MTDTTNKTERVSTVVKLPPNAKFLAHIIGYTNVLNSLVHSRSMLQPEGPAPLPDVTETGLVVVKTAAGRAPPPCMIHVEQAISEVATLISSLTRLDTPYSHEDRH